MVGKLDVLNGSFSFSEQVKLRYFEQDLYWENEKETPIQIVSDCYPSLTIKEVRKNLACCGIIGEHAMQSIGTLSGGEQAKVKICLLTLTPCNFIIMDEPTSGLDPLVRSQFLEIVMDYMKNGGKGVFFSTHITSDLDKIADMLILIDGGKIILQQSKDDLLDTFRIVKGNVALLNDQNRQLIRGLKVSSFGFTGITDHVAKMKKELPDVLLEKATIEDIMLAYIGGGNDDR